MAPPTANRASTLLALTFAALACGPLPSAAAATQQQGFLGAQAVAELQHTLRELLEAAHAGGSTPAARRLAKIERSIARTFQALPKNGVGRLAPLSVRYLVHNYFAKEHGWQIKGLEPQGMRTNVSEVHEASILRERSPAVVESLAEAYRSDRGLDLSDVAAMVAMLERLVLDEATGLLYAAYNLNGISAGDVVEHGELHEVLRSYLLLVEMGERGNLTDIDMHQEIKTRVAAKGTGWPLLVEFETDAVMSYDYEAKDRLNPFVEPLFAFEAAAHVAEELAHNYGRWQQAECGRMKEALIALDRDGSGLIPLSIFYAKSNKREYQFTESVEYLRQIGAVDDRWSREPRVRIANYVTGPSNCIASSTYYSVCCLNECEGVLNELEGALRAPTATPEQLLAVLQHVTSASMLAPRPVASDLRARLLDIASRHGGEVPLHGRLFAQWLHFAFPHECPFPQISEDGSELSAHHWLGGKAIASLETRVDHVESVVNAFAEEGVAAPQAGVAGAAGELPLEATPWSDEEVLPLLAAKPRLGASVFGLPVRLAVQGALCLVVLRLVLGGFASAARGGAPEATKKVAFSSARAHASADFV